VRSRNDSTLKQPPSHLRWAELWAGSGLDVDVNGHTLRGSLGPHDHDFVEIAVVSAGTATHQTLERRYRVAAGDAYLVRPGAWHALHDCERLRVTNCCFRRRLLERELLWLAEEERLRVLLWPFDGGGDGIVRLRLPDPGRETCQEALRQISLTPSEQPRAHQLAHLLLFLRSLASHLEHSRGEEADQLSGSSACVAEALRLISQDLSRPWTVAELAAAVAVSPAHLSRLFRRGVGRPPMAHLSRLRAEAAAAMLLRSDEQVSVIGAAVGWADPNYFARRFRAELGVSPTAFRRGAADPALPGDR
jgi:AraC-like DNA-binding protein/mannose-6-phosphate isomerase-like protein (cupin superfamily)